MSKGKTTVPTKGTMNLYYKPDRTTKPATIALYVLFALTVLLGLSKVLVYDLWIQVEETRAALAVSESRLAGVMAGHTTLPVIGIPVKGSFLDGLDALLATVQMPAGIPVATVAVDGAANAAILAAQMLALSDPELADRLQAMRDRMTAAVLESDKRVAEQFAQ